MANLGFAEVVAIPVKSTAGDETGEEIVSSNGSTAADKEETESGREKDVGLVIDQLPRRVLVKERSVR